MSHHFMVPTNENGLSLDPEIGDDISLAMKLPLGFDHVFLYSHGWWTDAIGAMQGYNRFTIEFSGEFRMANPKLANLPTLNLGIHWPSTLTEDQFSLLNYAQALSFYTMEKRADSVGDNCGYALLKFILGARAADAGPLNLHLVGHSFGCKVVCKTLQKLVDNSAAEIKSEKVAVDLVLMQAAFDDDLLGSEGSYSGLADIPGLRLLITRSDGDRALGTLYPAAHRLAHILGSIQPALGHSGPAPGVADRFGGATNISVGPEYQWAGPAPRHLLVADLSPLHAAHPETDASHSGHHSDVFRKEIYRLLAGFIFNN
jgi:hypothetical protein